MAKRTPRTSKKSPSKKRADRLTIAEIQSQLKDREKTVSRLERRRVRLAEALEGVDREIFAISGQTPTGTKRPRNSSNLGDALVDVLRGKEMGVTEAAEAVQAAGYSTTAANFRTIVNQRLIADKRFKKVRRGVYTTRANVK